MYRSKWFLHPILVFIFSIVALAASLSLYIYWYVEVSAGLKAVIQKANLDPKQVLAAQTWVVILALSILMAIILVGIFIIFVYSQKIYQLLRLQRNFIDNFTHELKTPVTSLKLSLQTLQMHDLSREDQRKYIGYLLHDAERLDEHINRILNLARIESKMFKAEFRRRDLVALVEEFCEKNKHFFGNCAIHIHNPSGHPIFHAVDLTLFEMLLMNMITNAVKYNGGQAPRLDITLSAQGRELNICFKDNGLGLPRAEVKKIFRKFYQVGRSGDMTAKGSGLGLYLVRSIVRLHNGHICAQSEGRGQGSLFTVVFPIEKFA